LLDMTAARVLAFAMVVLLSSVPACDGCNDKRSQARTLLRALNTLSDKRSLSDRSQALAELGQVELSEPALVRTRESCRAAHAGLLDAETAQTSARQALERASQQGRDAGLSGDSAAAIARDIEQSNQALAQAKVRFPECERAMRELISAAH
jgi:hypothetical protein